MITKDTVRDRVLELLNLLSVAAEKFYDEIGKIFKEIVDMIDEIEEHELLPATVKRRLERTFAEIEKIKSRAELLIDKIYMIIEKMDDIFTEF